MIVGLLVASSFTPDARAEAIRIGAPIPVTGPYSSDGQVMEKGLRLALDELNSSGGLLGNQLELFVFDIGDLTPDKLQAAATNLVEKEQVDVLINGYGGMGPDIPAFCPYPLPYIHNDATSNVVELRRNMNCSNIFMGSDVDVNYGKITFQQLMDLGHEFPNKKLAIIHGPYDWELNTTKGVQEVAESLGWQVVVNEEVPYETTQWSGILSKLREADPSLIYLELLDPAAVNTFASQFTQNPAKNALLYLGYTLSVPAFGEVIKLGSAEGMLGMTLSAQRPDDTGRAFVEAWRAKYNEDPPFSIAAQIYDELKMWAHAVEQAGSVEDHKAIREAILGTPYEGLTGRFEFNDEQYVPSTDDTVPTHLLQVQGGQPVQVRIGTKKIADFVAPPWLQ
ncbi:MAG TPA: ABC transporter substrate-binding protein [Alphaproteobacteria bacterium]|nr:ABC transporter substrate-binding protein [Alphaproteobacteria bacterium]